MSLKFLVSLNNKSTDLTKHVWHPLVSFATLVASTVGELQWVQGFNGGGFPYNAVSVGWTQKDALYICRGSFRDAEGGYNTAYTITNKFYIPGKLHPKHHACYISYDGNEYKISSTYEVATGSGIWMPFKKFVHLDSFEAGIEGGEYVYVCRGIVDGILQPGKFKPSHDTCYIPYHGKEHGLGVGFDILLNEE